MRIVTYFVIAWAIVVGPEVSSARGDDVRAEIEAANRAFGAAVRKGDYQAVAQLYTEDGQLIPPGAEIVRGRAAIAAYWKQGIEAGLNDLVLTTVDVESAGNLAYEVGTARVGNSNRDATEGKYLVVWKRQDGTWRLHRDIWNAAGN